MRTFWINLKSLFITHFYLILDRLGFSNENAFILMFHHVTNEQVDASPACKCNVEHFTKVLEYFKNNNIKVVSMNEAIVNIDKGLLSGYAVITFDDGIDNTFKIAYPLLKTYNFPFTVYITLNYLDKKGHLNFEQLEILNKESLCTLGAHSLTHPVLRTAVNAREEIVQSKQMLENIIKKDVLHFAFPYGGPTTVSMKNIFDTKAARYKSAVSTVESRLNSFSTITNFYLPRVNGSFFQSSNKV
jgi:peptidoglycan/xylan/chitin deacetylase (PgdA/CDA1 family)